MPLSAQQTADIQKQYDPMRKRAQQQEAANLQGQKDAMARRAAMNQGGPGGAYDKQQMIAQDSSAKRLQDANEGIDSQEAGALNQARQVQEQRDWQTAERVAGQDFARGERLGSQDFAANQADVQRKFQTSERLGSQDFSRSERLGSQDFSSGEAQKLRDFQNNQFSAQMERDMLRFEHEKFVDDFNMKMAEKMFNKKDMLEQLFSNFSMNNINDFWGGNSGSGKKGSMGGFVAGGVPGQLIGGASGQVFGGDGYTLGGKKYV